MSCSAQEIVLLFGCPPLRHRSNDPANDTEVIAWPLSITVGRAESERGPVGCTAVA